MNGQEIASFVALAAALCYLVLRQVRRRRAGTCCGAKVCPAARRVSERLGSLRPRD
jgi:hypothetical protein